MSKKNYIAFASILKAARGYNRSWEYNKEIKSAIEEVIDNIEASMIEIFLNDNPRFNADKFREAAR